MSSDSWCGTELGRRNGRTGKTATQTPWTGPTSTLRLESLPQNARMYYLSECDSEFSMGQSFQLRPAAPSRPRVSIAAADFKEAQLLSKVVEAICQSGRRRQNATDLVISLQGSDRPPMFQLLTFHPGCDMASKPIKVPKDFEILDVEFGAQLNRRTSLPCTVCMFASVPPVRNLRPVEHDASTRSR